MATAVWRCEPTRMRGRRRPHRFRGEGPMSPYPIDRRLRLCVRLGTQHLSRPGGPGGVLESLVGCFPPQGRTCVRGWPARAQAPARPPSGGHGRPVSVAGRPVCKPPDPRAGGKGARVQGCSRRPRAGPGLVRVRAGLCACGVLAAGARARRAACAGCVPRSREAAGRAIRASETPRASCCRR